MNSEEAKTSINGSRINGTRQTCDSWCADYQALVKRIYPTVLPILIAIAAFGVIANGLIIVASRRIPSKLSVNLRLCLSLAVADCAFCSVRILSFSLDRHLGFIDISSLTNACVANALTIAFALLFYGAGITSILHLCAIALNHLVGTMAPLRYKQCVTRRRCNAVITALWILPTLLLSVFVAVAEKNEWCAIKNRHVVPTIVASLNSLLFLGVAGVYVYIFRKHPASGGHQYSVEAGLMRKHVDPAQVAESRRNVIRVTLLITITFAIGWLPGFYWDALISWDASLLATMTPQLALAIGICRALLQLLKLLVNPFLYTLRIREIKKAVLPAFCHRSTLSSSYRRCSRD